MTTYKPGDVIQDKYEVTSVLGQGGMGIVYAARHLELGELVALKFLLPSKSSAPDAAARFLREARAGMRIKSEHVARVFDVGTDGEAPFMVMEHLEGKDLAALLRDRGALPVSETADYLLQACEAIAEAHAIGIVHRDLKPGNLFVMSPPHGLPFVKVLDFGISKSTSADDTSMTGDAVVVGSPRYMSPEQLQSSKDVDARSDVWSLGVILYEVLTGAPPFNGTTFPEVCTAILRGDPAELSEHRAGLPAGLEELVSEAFVVDRESRLPSVAAFAARLAPFGTAASRASLERIQGIAARVSAPPLAASALPAPFATTQIATDEGAAIGVTQSPPVPTQARSWPRAATLGALGIALATATGAILWSRMAPGPTTVVPAPSASAPSAMSSATAAALYETECNQGSLPACNGLGALYGRGDGIPQDNGKALELYTRACDGGYGRACMNLGAMHYDGTGVQKNEALGASLFQRACEHGEPLGCRNASDAFRDGRGVPQNMARSLTLAARACDAGVDVSCVAPAVAKLAGNGVPKDVNGGVSELDAMCTGGKSAACDQLALLYGKGGPDLTADPWLSREYENKACALGSKTGCDRQRLNAKIDRSNNQAAIQSRSIYETQCNAGSLLGCTLLGEDLRKGGGEDPARGKALLAKACKGGGQRACKDLADAGGR